MNGNQLKALDVLTESLKLIVTISTIFFGGLLAYRSSLNQPVAINFYYASIISLVSSSIVSVTNINSLINKINRGDDNILNMIEVKSLNTISILLLLAGISLGAWFLSEQTQSSQAHVASDTTTISDTVITVGSKNTSLIKITKNEQGKLTEVTITPK